MRNLCTGFKYSTISSYKGRRGTDGQTCRRIEPTYCSSLSGQDIFTCRLCKAAIADAMRCMGASRVLVVAFCDAD